MYVLSILVHQIEQVLEVYLQRGEAAIEAFESQDYELAKHWITWRKAAYHNFLVLDKKAAMEEQGYPGDPKLQALWRQIQKSSEKLDAMIYEYRGKLKSQLHALQIKKTKFQKFKSLHGTSRGFQREI